MSDPYLDAAAPLPSTRPAWNATAWLQWLHDHPHGAPHPREQCVGCGTLTARRAVTAVTYTYPDHNSPELTPWCDACERRRNRAQLERIAANDSVLPRLREEARQQLAVLGDVADAA